MPALTGVGVVALASVLTLQVAMVWPDAFRAAAQHPRAAISTPVTTGEAEPTELTRDTPARPPAVRADRDTGERSDDALDASSRRRRRRRLAPISTRPRCAPCQRLRPRIRTPAPRRPRPPHRS